MAAWQILFCLTVLSFVCRAVIPVGYMPDLSGERNTPFAITLCSMGGVTTVMQMDLSGEAEDSASDDAYGGENCPYGLSAGNKLMPGQGVSAWVGLVLLAAFAPAAQSQALPPQAPRGPPLGSRAPPSLNGWPQA